MRSWSNVVTARVRAASAMRAWSASSVRMRRVAAVIASTSPSGQRKPVSPSTFSSGSPPMSLETTGTLHAMASSAARPNVSEPLGMRKTSAMERISSTGSCLPRKRMSS